MASEVKPWIVLGLGLLAALAAFWVFDRISARLARRRIDEDDDPRGERRRRAVSGAAFAFQQVFDPGIEHVLRAERDAKAEEADPSGGDDDDPPIESFRDELIALLGSSPVEIESIRNVLTAAHREGHDWRALYEDAVRALVEDQPYLAPAIPLATRVAPRNE